MSAQVIRPQVGPQTAFLTTEADIAIYGGAAGGGKSFGLLLSPLQYTDVPGFAAVYFRRTGPELTGAGSLWEESQTLFRIAGGTPRQTPTLQWKFRAGTILQFLHLQHESDVYTHQGKQYAAIYFDELTHFEEAQFWYLVSRLRSTCGVRPHIRATCNPDPDSFVRALIDWWIGPDGLPIPERSGVLRYFVRDGDRLAWFDSREEAAAAYPSKTSMSLTFIPATLDDNKELLAKDPTYRAKLESLTRVEREQLLGGNWNSRHMAGEVFRREWFTLVEELPARRIATVRGWDKASTEPHPQNPNPDWTRGVKVAALEGGLFCVEHVESLRGTPQKVWSRMRAAAEVDGMGVQIGMWEDPGQAGKVDVEATKRELAPYAIRVVKASLDKVSYAKPWSALAEQGKIFVLRGDWNQAFFDELEAFPGKGKDDQVDAGSLAFQLLPMSVARPVTTGTRKRANLQRQKWT